MIITESMGTLVQCELRDGDRIHIGWIYKRLAVRGNVVSLKDMPGEWRVTAVYASMDYREANERSRDHAKHRDFSDV